MGNERLLQTRVNTFFSGLRLAGVPFFAIKIAGGMMQRVGLPDYILCVRGHFATVELKHPGERTEPTRIQQYVRAQIIRAGASTTVAWSMEEVRTFVIGLFTDEQRQAIERKGL